MGPQGCNARIIASQLCLAQRGVDFIVANLLQQHGRPALAAFQPWDQMMLTLAGMRRDLPVTQGAKGVIHW